MSPKFRREHAGRTASGSARREVSLRGVAACFERPPAGRHARAGPRSWDRIIHTTIGLRPHGDWGFLLKAEKLDQKALIHNYGHGGAGMSISWGTGALAADMALEHEERRAAVIIIVNCTGLGSLELFGDKELVPVKGQLTVLVPQPEVDYQTAGGITVPGTPGIGIHMMPRSDGIVLGGTAQRGIWTTEPDETERKRIVDGHIELFSQMRGL